MPHGNKHAVDRRKLMKYLGAAGAAGIAGCGGGGNQQTETPTQTSTETPEGTTTQTPPSKQGPTVGGRFIEGTTKEARSLNPLKIGSGPTWDRLFNLLDGGCGTVDKNTIYPEWFEKWELSDSFDRIEYKLRPNLSWGEPWGQLTAEDYMRSITELMHPKTAWYPYVFSYFFTVGGEPIKFRKTGKLTLEADLPQPRPFMFYKNDIKIVYPIPKEIVNEYADTQDVSGLNQDPAVVNCKFNGNLGPYDLKNWNRQSVIVFSRNENYYKRKWADDPRYELDYSEAPYFDEHAMQVFDAGTTKLSALKAGQIHYTDEIPSRKIEEFKANEDVAVRTDKYVGFSGFLTINERANAWQPLRNREVRYALANLYSRETIVNEIMNGKGGVQGTLHPNWGPYYPDELYTPEWTISRAKELLEQGTSSDYGYSGDTFVGPEGNQVELKAVVRGGKNIIQLKAQYLKRRLEKAGIKVNMETTGLANLLFNYFYTFYPAEGVDAAPQSQKIAWDTPAVFNWGPRDKAVSKKSWDLLVGLGFSYSPYDPTGTVIATHAKRGNFNAYGYYPDKNLAKMAERAKTTTNREKAVQIITNILQYIAKDQPLVYAFNPMNAQGFWDGPDKQITNYGGSEAKSYWDTVHEDALYWESK